MTQQKLFALTAAMVREINQIRAQVASLFGDINPSPGGQSVLDHLFFEAVNGTPSAIGDRNFQTVELSSATINGDGTYSGNWVSNSNGTQTAELSVRIKQISGQTLSTGKYYLAYYSHFDETNHVGVFIVPDSTGGGGGGGITVGYNTNTPTESGSAPTVSSLGFYKSTGITLGTYSGGYGVMGLEATQSQAGIVTAAAQQFGGGKQAVGAVSATTDTAYGWAANPTTGGWSGEDGFITLDPTNYRIIARQDIWSGSEYVEYLNEYNTDAYGPWRRETATTSGGPLGNHYVRYTHSIDSGGTGIFHIESDGFDSAFKCDGNKGITDTIDLTTATSVTVTGGIITGYT